MTPGTNGGACRPVATFLAGVVLTMIAFYVAEFRRTITRDEAAQLIQDMRPGPPWVQDRTFVMGSLEQHRRAIDGCVSRYEWEQWQTLHGKRTP